MNFDNYMLSALLKVMGKHTSKNGLTASEPELTPLKLHDLRHGQKPHSRAPIFQSGFLRCNS